jgi:hypothetical protein
LPTVAFSERGCSTVKAAHTRKFQQQRLFGRSSATHVTCRRTARALFSSRQTAASWPWSSVPPKRACLVMSN